MARELKKSAAACFDVSTFRRDCSYIILTRLRSDHKCEPEQQHTWSGWCDCLQVALTCVVLEPDKTQIHITRWYQVVMRSISCPFVLLESSCFVVITLVKVWAPGSNTAQTVSALKRPHTTFLTYSLASTLTTSQLWCFTSEKHLRLFSASPSWTVRYKRVGTSAAKIVAQDLKRTIVTGLSHWNTGQRSGEKLHFLLYHECRVNHKPLLKAKTSFLTVTIS